MSLLKSIVMGGIDGTITSFAVAAGASFTDTPRDTAAVVGFSSVVADGISMGVSEYVSSTSEQAVTTRVGSPFVLAIACFSAFAGLGCVPLLVFIATENLLSTSMFALVALMLLGAGQTVFTRENVLCGLLRTALLGAFAGGAAVGVASLAASD